MSSAVSSGSDTIVQIQQLVQDGQYEQAIQLAQSAGLTQVIPQIQAIRLIRQAMALADQGQYQQAQQLLQQAQQIYPNFSYSKYFAYIQGAQIVSQVNKLLSTDPQRAQQIFQQFVSLASQYPDLFPASYVATQEAIVNAYVDSYPYVQKLRQDLQNADFKSAYQDARQAQQILQSVGQGQQFEGLVTALSYLATVSSPPQPSSNMTVEDLANYVNQLNAYYQNFLTQAQKASRVYPPFAQELLPIVSANAQVSSSLANVMQIILKAVTVVLKDTPQAITLLGQAQQLLQQITPTPQLQNLYNAISQLVQKALTQYRALLQVKGLINQANVSVQNGQYQQAQQLLQQAQQISDNAGLGIDLSNYVRGLGVLQNLQPIPQPKVASLSDLSTYLITLQSVLENNLSVLQQAQRYINVDTSNLQADLSAVSTLEDTVNSVMTLVTALQRSQDPLQMKGQALSTVQNAISTVSSIKGDLAPLASGVSTALKQLFGTLNTYFDALENVKQAQDLLNLVPPSKLPADPVQALLALSTFFTQAEKNVERVINVYAPKANQDFQSLGQTPPFDVKQLQSLLTEYQEYLNAVQTAINVLQSLNEKPSGTDVKSLARYYQQLSNTLQTGIRELDPSKFSDPNVQQFVSGIQQELQQELQTVSALARAFTVIADASVVPKLSSFDQRHLPDQAELGSVTEKYKQLATAYATASQILKSTAGQSRAVLIKGRPVIPQESGNPQVLELASQFSVASQMYENLYRAQLYEAEMASSSPQQQLQLLTQERDAIQNAITYADRLGISTDKLQNAVSQLNDTIQKMQNAISLQERLQQDINAGDYLGALIVMRVLLSEQGVDISNVVNAVTQNDFQTAVSLVNANNSIPAQAKQFLTQLVSTLAVQYYVNDVQFQVSQAHLTATNLVSALQQEFNFEEQVQPILQHLGRALQDIQEAQQFAQYLGIVGSLQQLQQEIGQQYNALQEQVRSISSNPAGAVLNVLLGFANSFNTAMNNMMNDVNNFIYSHLGKNQFTEVLSGVADGAIFVLLSSIPFVGRVFTFASMLSFVSETAFDLVAGSSSRAETLNSLWHFLTSPQGIAMIATMIVGGGLLKKVGPEVPNVEVRLPEVRGVELSDVVHTTVDDTVKPLVERIDAGEAFKANDLVLVKADVIKLVESKLSPNAEELNLKQVDVLLNPTLEKVEEIGPLKVTINAERVITDEIKTNLNVTPKITETAVPTLQGGKLGLTTVTEEGAKLQLATGNITGLLDTIKTNVAGTLAEQLFNKLKEQPGNTIDISPNEAIGNIDGKLFDIVYNDGKPSTITELTDAEALAKLSDYVKSNVVGNFFDLNKPVIESLLQNSHDLKSLEYNLTNDIKNSGGLVIRNEKLSLGGQGLKSVTTLKGLTEAVTETKVTGLAQPLKATVLSPEDVNALLSTTNTFSDIFKQLIEEHPETKDVLLKMAGEGKITSDLTSLRNLATNLEEFYTSLDASVKDALQSIPNDLLNGVDVADLVKRIEERYVKQNGTNIQQNMTLSDLLKYMSDDTKAKIVQNFLDKYSDNPDVKQVLGVIKSLPVDEQVKIMSSAFKMALQDNEAILPSVLSTIRQSLGSEGVAKLPSPSPSPSSPSPSEIGPSTPQSAGGGETGGTILQPQSIQTTRFSTQFQVPLTDLLSHIVTDWNTLSLDQKNAIIDGVNGLLDQGDVTLDQLKTLVSDVTADKRLTPEEVSLLDSIRNLVSTIREIFGNAEALKTLKDLAEKISPAQFAYILSVLGPQVSPEVLTQLDSIPPDQLNHAIILSSPELNTFKDAVQLALYVTRLYKTDPAKAKLVLPKLKQLLDEVGIQNLTALLQINSVLQSLEQEGVTVPALVIVPSTAGITKKRRQRWIIVPNPPEGSDLIVIPLLPRSTSSVTIPANVGRYTVSLTINPQNEETTGNTTLTVPQQEISVGNTPPVTATLTQVQQLLDETPPPSSPNVTPPPPATAPAGPTVPSSSSNQNMAEYLSRKQVLIL